ncbi:MAG: adenosylmethionine decarboxylase [Fimbriimonadaceae bacterium]|nr:adenosylmethionine decarboxylase [Fimbriimonadaceae bacterium]
MVTLNALLITALAAVAIPLADRQQRSWISRLMAKFRRPSVHHAAPPLIDNDAGWSLIHSENVQAFEDWISRDPDGLPRLKGEEPSLGSHILIELFDCDPQALELENSVGGAMKDAAVASEATVVTDSFHEFKPYGVSGAVIIQESHYTIHTWPEHKYAAVDLFYCGGTIYVDRAIEVLRERFKPGRMKFLVVRRGLQGDVEGK